MRLEKIDFANANEGENLRWLARSFSPSFCMHTAKVSGTWRLRFIMRVPVPGERELEREFQEDDARGSSSLREKRKDRSRRQDLHSMLRQACRLLRFVFSCHYYAPAGNVPRAKLRLSMNTPTRGNTPSPLSFVFVET